ncbi:unnamed protein product [Coregonus sp. 'balchen']|nr:unnamed protein product [Coregonus sp. 'balchen']
MEQPIFICFTPARRMVWEELSSQNEQYVDEEVGQRTCLALIPWSGPLWVPSSICKIEQHIFISRAGMMVLDELSSQLEEYVDEEVRQQPCLALIPWSGPLWVSNAIFTMEQPIIISFTPARRMVWEELSSQNEQYVDEEVGHRSCLALIPWSGPLCVPIFPVFSKAKPVYYLTRAGRMLVTELAVLNTQDVRQFQQAYDLLVNFINEPANRERLEQEMALVGIDRINFADVFYEFVLLGLLEGKTSLPISKPGSFLYLLLQVIMRIDPPGGAWTEAAENFYLLVKGQMKAWLESIFNLNESIYESPERLSGEVMRNLEIQVEFLLSSLD